MPNERKPHVLKVKQDIVELIDDKIAERKADLVHEESLAGELDLELRRTIAIWIKQRNRLAKDAELAVISLPHTTRQGSLIYMEVET